LNLLELLGFLLVAVTLLGSPGPAIAAILAVGKNKGWTQGLRFYIGLMIGLAIAAGISIVGLLTAISLFPMAELLMTLFAIIYLFYLAFKIASSPLGQETSKVSKSYSSIAGLFLGLTNPKAYASFSSLFASFQIYSNNNFLDSTMKWFIVVIVMIIANIVWLWIGVKIGQLKLSNKSERILNYSLASTIVIAALVTLL